jgi:hypothetical protein
MFARFLSVPSDPPGAFPTYGTSKASMEVSVVILAGRAGRSTVERKWVDRRDNTYWTVEAVPVGPEKRVGGYGHRVWFRAPPRSHAVMVPSNVGARFRHMTDPELERLLDRARYRGIWMSPSKGGR